MPGVPKDPGQRRRRASGQAQWKQLPETGSGRKAPPLPRRTGGWLVATKNWWASIWASPMSAMWLDADVPELHRMAAMVDSVTRRPEQVALQAQITALADRFGLSPKSRRMLQWEITRANENQGSGAPVTPIRERKLRAVG